MSMVACLAACGSIQAPVEPGRSSETLITLGEAEHMTVVDGETGRIIARPGPLSRFAVVRQVSPDGRTIYVFDPGSGPSQPAEVVAVDMGTFRVRWREPWPIRSSDDERPLGPRLAGTEVLLQNASWRGNQGVIALDDSSRQVRAFWGPAAVPLRGLTRLPSRLRGVPGDVVVGGARPGRSGTFTGCLYILDGATLSVRDSIVVVPASSNPFGGIDEVLASPDGRRVYVAAGRTLVSYDLVERRAVASTGLPTVGTGRLAIAPDGRSLYYTDAGDGRNFPGSGFVHVFDAELKPRPPIDLRSVGPGGRPIQTNHAAVSSDGKLLYVAAGSASRGPLYGVQYGRVLVIDAATGALIKEIATGDWYVQDIIIRR